MVEPMDEMDFSIGPAVDRENMDTFLRFVEDRNTFLSELIDIYLESTPYLLADLRDGLEGSDWSKMSSAVHTLKSSSKAVSATRLSSMAREFEISLYGIEDDANGVELQEGYRLWVDEIFLEYERVSSDLKVIREDL